MGLKTFHTTIDNFLVIALKPSQEQPAANVTPGFYLNYGFFQGPVTLPGTGVVVPDGYSVQSFGMVCPDSSPAMAEIPSGNVVTAQGVPLPGPAMAEAGPGISASPAYVEAGAGVSSTIPSVVAEGVSPTPAMAEIYPQGNSTQLSGYNWAPNVAFFEHLIPNPGRANIRLPEKGTILIISSAYKGIHFPHEKNPSEVKSQVNFPKGSKLCLLWQEDTHPVKLNNNPFQVEKYNIKNEVKADSKLFHKNLYLYSCEFPDIGSVALTKTGSANNFEVKINGNGAMLHKYNRLIIFHPIPPIGPIADI